jgi:hypothetical protein
MDTTTDVNLIQTCVEKTDVADCNEGCQWRHGKSTTDVINPEKIPLFSEEFCHPVIVNKDTDDSVLETCGKEITKDTCSIAAGCNWSTGTELIPDHDFCAPMDMTKDIALVK